MLLSLLSADLILLILEVTDQESLLQFCRVSPAVCCHTYVQICSYCVTHMSKASRWIYFLVMETKSLRYQVELALSGMRDGPPSEHPPPARLEQLLTYKKAWPALTWSHEDRLEISSPTIMGVSGGFFYHASENSHQYFQWTLELYELRSFRTSHTVSHLRRLRFNVPFDISNVVIDLSQNLLALVELDQPNKCVCFSGSIGQFVIDSQRCSANPICARLRCYDLWTCAAHPRASAHVFALQTHWWGPLCPEQHVLVKQVQICGSRIALAVRLEMMEGRAGSTEIVVVDWRNNRMKRVSENLLKL
jgi:hypothetical protein